MQRWSHVAAQDTVTLFGVTPHAADWQIDEALRSFGEIAADGLLRCSLPNVTIAGQSYPGPFVAIVQFADGYGSSSSAAATNAAEQAHTKTGIYYMPTADDLAVKIRRPCFCAGTFGKTRGTAASRLLADGANAADAANAASAADAAAAAALAAAATAAAAGRHARLGAQSQVRSLASMLDTHKRHAGGAKGRAAILGRLAGTAAPCQSSACYD
eukprot:6183613-Pleurochrysis_carterae.AAC.2